MNYDEYFANQKAKFEALKHAKPGFEWLHVSTQVKTYSVTLPDGTEEERRKIEGVTYDIGANKTKRALRAMKKAHKNAV